MPAKSVGTVQSSFLLNVSLPPYTMLDFRLENDNKCMLARKFCNPCLATCLSFFTTLYKGGGGFICLKKGNELKNIHLLRVQSRCSNYFWRAFCKAKVSSADFVSHISNRLTLQSSISNQSLEKGLPQKYVLTFL